MALYALKDMEFKLIPALDDMYATCVLESSSTVKPDLAISIDYHWHDHDDVELMVYGNHYSQKVFSTYHSLDWAEFDYLFGREEWQAFLEELREFVREERLANQ